MIISNQLLRYLMASISSNPVYLFDVYDRGLQYFSLNSMHLSQEEIFVNCGAYIGDTIEDFLKCVNYKFKRIYAFEADKNTFKTLKKNIQSDKVVMINKGCYSHNNGIGFLSANDSNGKMSRGMSMIIHEGDKKLETIETCRLDDVINENITFINMDIEGAELEALKGAYKLLKQSKPQMAISVYHKKTDLIEIPDFIKGIDEQYKFALREYCPWTEELILYAYH